MTAGGNGVLNIYRSRITYAVATAAVVLVIPYFGIGTLERDGLAGVASFATAVWVDVWLVIILALTLRNWDACQHYTEKQRERRKPVVRFLWLRVLLVLLGMLAAVAGLAGVGLLGQHWLDSGQVVTQILGGALFVIRAAIVAAGGLWGIAWIRRIAAREAV